MKNNNTTNDLRINNLLVEWYEQNKRDLPWRHTTDPYKIWISEVILQQTRIDQGLSYYQRFISSFPSIEILAKADEEEVLKLWQGLGYYSRARNLHAAAKTVMATFLGVFPDNYNAILSLKGVGLYTAAAIASFSFNLPYAVVDGNVYRVLSRLFAIDEAIDSTKGKKIFADLAQLLLNKDNPATHNQAIMEFGAMQCKPVSPNCDICPLSHICLAQIQKGVNSYPVKAGKTKVSKRFFNYFYISHKSSTYLKKRGVNDIWENLYELPLIESDCELSLIQLQIDPRFVELFEKMGLINIDSKSTKIKHILSHQIILATFYKIEISQEGSMNDRFVKIKKDEIDKYPIPRLIERYLETNLD